MTDALVQDAVRRFYSKENENLSVEDVDALIVLHENLVYGLSFFGELYEGTIADLRFDLDYLTSLKFRFDVGYDRKVLENF